MNRKIKRFGAAALLFAMLLGIFAVGAFAEETEQNEFLGEISACSYSSGKISIKGTLRHNSVLKYQNGTISVYALSPEQDVSDIYSGEVEPVLENSAISIRFEFSVSGVSVLSRLKKYAVAVIGENGPVLVDSPRYPSVKASEKGMAFKGVETGIVAGAVETAAGLSMLDVDLGTLVSKGNNGYIYSVDENRYFFDRNYVTKLDSKVKILTGANCAVYLRLSGLEVFYDSQKQLDIYATVRFLCSRYSSYEDGLVCGIVMGERMNEQIPDDKTTEQYAKASYDTIYTILAAADDANNPTSVVLPVSDAWGENAEVGVPASDKYLDALFAVCARYSESRFAVMAELTKNPYAIDNDYIEQMGSAQGNDGAKKRAELIKAAPDCGYISTENAELFCSEFKSLSEKHFGKAVKLALSWSPSENTTKTALNAAYVYNYYKLFFAGQVDSFVLSLPDDEGLQSDALGDLKYKMKYIDTDKSLQVGESAKEVFGISDWKNEIPAFDQSLLAVRTVKDSLTLEKKQREDIIGTYDYWDFSDQSGNSGWLAGVGCSSLSIENSSDGRALVAKLSSDGALPGGYSFFTYKYEEKESFKYNDYLIVDLLLTAKDNSSFELNIMLGGEDFLYEYRSDGVASGQKYTLSLDITDISEKNPIEYIRICSKDITSAEGEYTLDLYSVRAASRSYGDEELAQLIQMERDRIHGKGENINEEGPEIFWVLVVGATVAVTVIVMIMVNRSKKNTRPEDRV